MHSRPWSSSTVADWVQSSFKLMFVAGLLLLFPGVGVPDTINVSPDGNDANSGTQSQPLRTLQGARDRVRSMDKNRTQDVVVLFKCGRLLHRQHRAIWKGRLGCEWHSSHLQEWG